MGRNLKYQYLYAINNSFKEGMDKHSLKKNGGLGTSKIFSYADRKNMIDVASNFSNFMKEQYSSVKKVKDVKGEHIQAFLNSKANSCSKATLEQYRSKFKKLEKCVNNTYNTRVTYDGFTVPVAKENTKLRNTAMSHEDFEKLEKALSNSRSSAKIAIQLSARLGLRASECSKLQGRDIDVIGGYVHVADSKGGRDRDISIREADRSYFKELKDNYEDMERLCPVQSDSLNKAINRAMDKIGLKGYKDTSLHAIRKMYAQEQFDYYRDLGDEIMEAWGKVSVALGHGKDRTDLLNTYVLNVH